MNLLIFDPAVTSFTAHWFWILHYFKLRFQCISITRIRFPYEKLNILSLKADFSKESKATYRQPFKA